MYTIAQAREKDETRKWIAVGVLPPHVQETEERKNRYRETLEQAGASIVLDNVEKLDPGVVRRLVS
jgi:HAD superfamily phosphatase